MDCLHVLFKGKHLPCHMNTLRSRSRYPLISFPKRSRTITCIRNVILTQKQKGHPVPIILSCAASLRAPIQWHEDMWRALRSGLPTMQMNHTCLYIGYIKLITLISHYTTSCSHNAWSTLTEDWPRQYYLTHFLQCPLENKTTHTVTQRNIKAFPSMYIYWISYLLLATFFSVSHFYHKYLKCNQYDKLLNYSHRFPPLQVIICGLLNGKVDEYGVSYFCTVMLSQRQTFEVIL